MTTLTVGTNEQYSTIKAAVAAAQPGDTVAIDAGTYTNDFPGLINGLTIKGVGGLVKLVASGAQPSNGKAYLEVQGNTTLANLDISGVTVPDGNGAAVRYDSGNLTIQNSILHNNQEGILGANDSSGSITITGSEIYGNGVGDGYTHNIYIGDVATFTLTGSYIHDANAGHEVKTRAENNIITNNRIEDNNSTASYQIDMPNGGNATITGNTIQKSANGQNRIAVSYGEEGNLHSGSSVTISNNVFVNNMANATLLKDAPGIAMKVSGNTQYGFTTIDAAGTVTSGVTALLSSPALDTSSPVTSSGSASNGSGSSNNGSGNNGSSSAGGNSSSNNNNGSGNGSGNVTPARDTTPPTLTVSQSISGTTTSTSNLLSGTITDSGSGAAAVEIFVNTGGRSYDIGQATLSGSSWSYNVTNLAAGTYTFYAVGYDRAGNATATTQTGASETVVATTPTPTPTPVSTRDTTPPTLTVSQSISGTTTSTSNVLSGTITDSGSGAAAVEIFVNTGGRSYDIGQATLNGSSWSYNVTNLAAGTYTFYAVGYDRAGNTTATTQTGASETVVATTPTPTPTPVSTRDTTPPTLTVSQSISGTTTSTSNVLSGTITDSGSGAAAVEIFVNTGGRSYDIGQATLNGSNWSYNVTNLAAGTYTFYAVGYDRAGNTTATTQTGASETVVAAAPSPVAPAIGTVSIASSAMTFSGTAAAGSTVTLSNSAVGVITTLGSATADQSGTWQITTKSLASNLINALTATASSGGSSSKSAGSFLLASAGNDTMSGTAGQADLFAFGRVTGQDIVNGFESSRDVIDLAGTSYSSFAQLQKVISGTSAAVIKLDAQDSITLTGVNANQLSASNFRFS